MKISKEQFINELLKSCKECREHSMAFWKLKTLALNGDTYYLPENDCYYGVYDKFMFCCFSKDNKCYIPFDELNEFKCISMSKSMYEGIQNNLTDFNISYGYKLHYDFNYKIVSDAISRYSIESFDFLDDKHYVSASKIINQGNGDWIMPDNLKKIMREPVFDPSMWLFVKDNNTNEFIGISISTYDVQLKETDIEWFYILPEYHRKGVGRYLISEIIKRSEYRSSDIRVGGTNEFYKKCGFIEKESNVWASKEGVSLYAPCIQPNVLP